MKREKLACTCNHVSYGQIIDCVKAGSTTFDQVQEKTGCSRGCGNCREFIETLIRDIIQFPDDYQ